MIGAQLPITGQVDLLDIEPSYWDFLDARSSRGWNLGPIALMHRFFTREEMRARNKLDYTDPNIIELYRTIGVTPPGPNDVKPLIPKSQLNEAYALDGLNFKEDEYADVAAYIAETKRKENRRNEIEHRARNMRTYGTGFLAEMVAGIADPLNIASAFIPVVGQARFASMLTRMGPTAARATRGLIEGTVGAAVVEPLVLMGALGEQADYTALDSLLNVAFGGVLGAGLHTGLGAIKDIRARATDRLTEADAAHVLDAVERERNARTPTPQNEVAVQFDAMPIDVRENLMRATVAQMEEGKSVSIGEVHEPAKTGTPVDAPEAKTSVIADMPEKMPATTENVSEVMRRLGWKEGQGSTAMTGSEYMEFQSPHVPALGKRRVMATVRIADHGGAMSRTPTFNLPKGGEFAPREIEATLDRIVKGHVERVAPQAKTETPIARMAAAQARPEATRTADFEASKDASRKIEVTKTKAPTDSEREIADLETEIADIADRIKPLQESTGIKDDMLKVHDDAIKTAKSEAQAYQVAAMCKLGL